LLIVGAATWGAVTVSPLPSTRLSASSTVLDVAAAGAASRAGTQSDPRIVSTRTNSKWVLHFFRSIFLA